MLQLPQDPDLMGAGPRPPLSTASGAGHVEVVRLLLEAGASGNLAGNDGFTALTSASVQGHVEIVQLLLEAGAEKESAGQQRLHGFDVRISARSYGSRYAFCWTSVPT